MIKNILNNSRRIFVYLLFIYISLVLWRSKVWNWPNQILKNIRNAIKEERSIRTPDCKEYGRDMPVDAYIKNYIVKPGDSLLSIAKNELGSSDRLYELISFNSTKYPDLGVPGSSLKVGTKLEIPLKDLGVIQGRLMKKAGKINGIEEGSMMLINAAANYGDGFPLSLNTRMIGKSKFEKDDCVIVILDNENGSLRTILVELQKQKN